MKAITLWQPWATLVACGVKSIETRSWATPHRGPLLIHAAKRWDDGLALALAGVNHVFRGEGLPTLPRELPLGCVVAIARLVDCVRCEADSDFAPLEHEFGDLAPGRYAWRLTDVVRVDPPVSWRGMQGLWDVPPDLEVLIETVCPVLPSFPEGIWAYERRGGGPDA